MRRLKALESFDKSLPESRWKGFLTSCAPFCKPVEEPGFSLYNEVINPSEGGIFMNRLASAVRSLAQAGGSFYLYDESSIFRHIDLLKETFPQAQFLYSIKCNPNPHVIQSVCSRGLGADTASFGRCWPPKKRGFLRIRSTIPLPERLQKTSAGPCPDPLSSPTVPENCCGFRPPPENPGRSCTQVSA